MPGGVAMKVISAFLGNNRAPEQRRFFIFFDLYQSAFNRLLLIFSRFI